MKITPTNEVRNIFSKIQYFHLSVKQVVYCDIHELPCTTIVHLQKNRSQRQRCHFRPPTQFVTHNILNPIIYSIPRIFVTIIWPRRFEILMGKQVRIQGLSRFSKIQLLMACSTSPFCLLLPCCSRKLSYCLLPKTQKVNIGIQEMKLNTSFVINSKMLQSRF